MERFDLLTSRSLNSVFQSMSRHLVITRPLQLTTRSKPGW